MVHLLLLLSPRGGGGEGCSGLPFGPRLVHKDAVGRCVMLCQFVTTWCRVTVFMFRRTMAVFMRSDAFRHDASMRIRGRIVTNRNATHEKRIRVGRG